MLSPNFEINKSIDPHSTLLMQAIFKVGRKQIVKEDEIISTALATSSFFFYIQAGLFKTVKMLNNKPHIVGFTFSGDVDTDLTGLLSSSNYDYTIVALMESEVVTCTWENLELELGKEMYLTIVNHFLARYVNILQNRLIESIALSAEQRYRNLIEQHSIKIAEIPLADLSAYLGITPQSMSRIRSAKF